MRRQDVGPVALLMGTSAFLGAALYFSAPAHPDPYDPVVAYAARFGGAVCQTLDEYSSLAGTLGVLEAIEEDGFTSFEAGEVVGLSVAEICPRHSGLMRQFVAAFAGRLV